MVRSTDSRRARNSDSVMIGGRRRPVSRPSRRRCFLASSRVEPLTDRTSSAASRLAATWTTVSGGSSAESRPAGRRPNRGGACGGGGGAAPARRPRSSLVGVVVARRPRSSCGGARRLALGRAGVRLPGPACVLGRGGPAGCGCAAARLRGASAWALSASGRLAGLRRRLRPSGLPAAAASPSAGLGPAAARPAPAAAAGPGPVVIGAAVAGRLAVAGPPSRPTRPRPGPTRRSEPSPMRAVRPRRSGRDDSGRTARTRAGSPGTAPSRAAPAARPLSRGGWNTTLAAAGTRPPARWARAGSVRRRRALLRRCH